MSEPSKLGNLFNHYYYRLINPVYRALSALPIPQDVLLELGRQSGSRATIPDANKRYLTLQQYSLGSTALQALQSLQGGKQSTKQSAKQSAKSDDNQTKIRQLIAIIWHLAGASNSSTQRYLYACLLDYLLQIISAQGAGNSSTSSANNSVNNSATSPLNSPPIDPLLERFIKTILPNSNQTMLDLMIQQWQSNLALFATTHIVVATDQSSPISETRQPTTMNCPIPRRGQAFVQIPHPYGLATVLQVAYSGHNSDANNSVQDFANDPDTGSGSNPDASPDASPDSNPDTNHDTKSDNNWHLNITVSNPCCLNEMGCLLYDILLPYYNWHDDDYQGRLFEYLRQNMQYSIDNGKVEQQLLTLNTGKNQHSSDFKDYQIVQPTTTVTNDLYQYCHGEVE